MKSILDRSFQYTPSGQTTTEYLRAKFKRIQKQLQANQIEAQAKVAPIPQRRKQA